MTHEILDSMKVRDKLYKSFARTKDPNLKEFLGQRYKAYRNRIVTICRQRKSSFYQNFFQENMTNAREIWKGINSIISLKKKSFQTEFELNINGKLTSDPIKVANEFNCYFTSIADNLRQKIPKTPKSFKHFLKEQNLHSMFLAPISESEILECLSSLDTNKANGPSSIPSKILNLIQDNIAVPLKTIFNLCFSTGIFPEILKIAKVLPIYKQK